MSKAGVRLYEGTGRRVGKLAAMKPLDYFNAKAAREAASQQPPLDSTENWDWLGDVVVGAIQLALELIVGLL